MYEDLDVNSYRLCTRSFHDDIISLQKLCLNIIGDAFRKRLLTILMCLNLKWLYKFIYDSRMMFIYLLSWGEVLALNVQNISRL